MENMVTNPNFWKDRRVFMTGHTGFKGGWLSLWLSVLGAKVTGFSLPPPTNPSLFAVASVDRAMQSLTGDICDREALLSAVRNAAPEIVFHLAAQPLVRQSYATPVETYATNVMGTAHLLDAVRQVRSVRACVVVTTDKCYQNREWIWGYREDEPMGGPDPYSSSKGCAELLVGAWRDSYFNTRQFSQHQTGLASARAGNVIGGGDWAADRLVPDLIRAFAAGQTAVIRKPGAIRPWQHVLEPLHGYMLLAQRLYAEGPLFSSPWNFGPLEADARPVAWIAETLAQQWGAKAGFRIDESAATLHEANYLRLDCAKAHGLLGWHPVWDIRRSLVEIVNWHKAHLAGADMRDVTLDQIALYQRDALGKRK